MILEHVVITKTGRLCHLELASNALTEAGIPHFKQEEQITGLITGMHFPVMGPGTFWNLLVPIPEQFEAERILSQLPIDLSDDPALWQFNSNTKLQRAWKIMIAIMLSV